MARRIKRLSVKEIESNDKPGLYCDGNGLYLQVSQQKTKSWVFRFQIAGRPRKMGLGEVRIGEVGRITLADARKKAYAAHLLVADGIDPIEERNARKAKAAVESAKALTFRQCAKGYIDANKHAWKNAKHGAQWEATLETYAYPVIGKLPVGAVDEGHIMKILQPIWTTKTETASRVRARIEKVLDRARVLKLRTGDNPARWIGHLDQLLPARSQVAPGENQPALPYKQIPEFMPALRQREGIGARALEFTILTIARTGDTIGAKWHEIDLKEKLWTVPAARLKSKRGTRKRDHVVPLSDRALAILKDLPREGDYVFPGPKAGGPLSNAAMAAVIDRMNEDRVKAGLPKWVDPQQDGREIVPHGFRSTFRDWASEQTDYPSELCEMAMAHTVSDKVEAAYRRGDMREKRVRLMRDWAEFCTSSPRGESAKVIEMRAAQ
jgi:integrase